MSVHQQVLVQVEIARRHRMVRMMRTHECGALFVACGRIASTAASIAARKAGSSPGGTSWPCCVFASSFGTSPTALAITGIPRAIASSTTSGMPSLSEGSTRQSMSG